MNGDILNRGQLNPLNEPELASIRERYYMLPILQIYNNKVSEFGLPQAANHLTDIMREAESDVNELLEQRKEAGEINNIDQARKSTAGNQSFQHRNRFGGNLWLLTQSHPSNLTGISEAKIRKR